MHARLVACERAPSAASDHLPVVAEIAPRVSGSEPRRPAPRPRYHAPMTPPFSSDRIARVHRNPWFMGLAASPLALALVDVILAAASGRPQIMAVLPHLIIAGLVLPFFVWRKNPKPRELPARIEVDREAVRQGGQVLTRRAEIKEAFLMPRNDGALVARIRRKGLRPAIDLRVPDREEGRALLRSLGMDASQAAATFRLPSRLVSDRSWRLRFGLGFAAFVAMLAGLGILLAVLHLTAAMPALPVLYILGIATFVGFGIFAPTRLRVGADGVSLSWLRWKRFLGYGDMALVRRFEDGGWGKNRMAGIEITLKSGEVVRIPVQPTQSGVRDEVVIVEERIAEAIETWRRGDGAADAALVQRSGRAPGDWLRALRGIGAGANADARTAPVLPERLWRIVEDPAAPPDARAGAAAALGATIDDEGRTRLRAAAEATAAPRLRIAIEAAAKGTGDEELAAALAEVESAEAAKPRSAAAAG